MANRIADENAIDIEHEGTPRVIAVAFKNSRPDDPHQQALNEKNLDDHTQKRLNGRRLVNLGVDHAAKMRTDSEIVLKLICAPREIIAGVYAQALIAAGWPRVVIDRCMRLAKIYHADLAAYSSLSDETLSLAKAWLEREIGEGDFCPKDAAGTA